MTENNSLLNWNDNTQTTYVKGYKVFDPDWIGELDGNPFKYSCPGVFEVYTHSLAYSGGIHFFKTAQDCFTYCRFDHNNKVAEVIALGEVIEDDEVFYTNKIEIKRELTWEEVMEISRTGKDRNSPYNSGHHNSGHHNTAYVNTPYINKGYLKSNTPSRASEALDSLNTKSKKFKFF